MLDRAGAAADPAAPAPSATAPADEPSVNPDDEIKVEDIPF